MEPNSGKDKISHYEQLVEYQEEIKKSGEVAFYMKFYFLGF